MTVVELLPHPGVLELSDGRQVGVADIFRDTQYGMRFCWHCDTAMDGRRCFICGRFTTKQLPVGWREAAAFQSFERELLGHIHVRAYTERTNLLELNEGGA